MGGLKLSFFLLSSFGLKGSILNILNILFSYFIIALFFRPGLQNNFVSFSLSVLKFGVVLVGEGAGGYLSGEDARGGG